jgi:tetratricopeptide (TPR) repeat protein
MQKVIVIFGIVLCAMLLEGIAFFISSRIPAQPVVVPADSPFDETMRLAEVARQQNDFKAAEELLQQALDTARTQDSRIAAGYQMGRVLLDKYRRGGSSSLDAAAGYLQVAYENANNLDSKITTGFSLLDLFSVVGDDSQFLKYVEEMLSLSPPAPAVVELWRRKFNRYLNSGHSWSEMQEALVGAENLPVQVAAWPALLEEIRLCVEEKLLEDPEWFKQYADKMQIAAPENAKQALFQQVSSKLEEKIKTAAPGEQEDSTLRLAKALVSVGDSAGGNQYLQKYLDMEPTADLTETLVLMGRISPQVRDKEGVDRLVKMFLRRFDVASHTPSEISRVTELLSALERYDDASRILESYFKLADPAAGGEADLLALAVVMEAQNGRDANALGYMNLLSALDLPVPYGKALRKLVSLNLNRGNYQLVEEWISRFIDGLPSDSTDYKDLLFLLSEASYWSNRPVVDQLTIGSAAVRNSPGDARVAPVILRMAGFVENMGLYDLASSYYNRIGLLNFFQSDDKERSARENLGEQAMLGKARCLQKNSEWEPADHLLRNLCNRTESPLIRSEAAVSWAELAFRFGQRREAERRYDLADPQMLSATLRARYQLGRARLGVTPSTPESASIEDVIALLKTLPEEDRRQATVDFFNETFDDAYKNNNERAMSRLIDLAYQSDFLQWIPVQSYVLKRLFREANANRLEGLRKDLQEASSLNSGSALMDLTQTVSQLEQVNQLVKRHSKRSGT